MRKLLRGLGWVAAALVIAAIVARAVFFDVWTIPEDPDNPMVAAALVPTLAPGDVVLVTKRGAPGFGDLVRCTDPDDAKRFVIGRIVGLPHDLVDIDGAALRVNGTSYNGQYACPQPTITIAHPYTGDDVVLGCAFVEMGGGRYASTHSQKRPVAQPKSVEVPTGMVFLLSDDRDYHYDSRDFGVVPRSSCKARIAFRIVGKEGWTSERRFSVIH